MPVKRSPQKPTGADRLPDVQVTGASDVDEVGSIVSNVGRDFGRLEAEARREKFAQDIHNDPVSLFQKTCSLENIRRVVNRGRVASLTPSVEGGFYGDTPDEVDDQIGFDGAADVNGAGGGDDPDVVARALQDAQNAQRRVAGEELVKKQLRQSIGNRKGVVTRLITELNRQNCNRKFLQTIQPRMEESVEKLKQACDALLSIESLSTTEVDEIHRGFLEYDWRANNARDMASNLLNFLDDQDNYGSNDPKIPGTTMVKVGYIPDYVPPLPIIPPFKAPPLGPKPPPKKVPTPQKMPTSNKSQHVPVLDIKKQAAREAGAFRDRLREVGRADRAGGQRQRPSPQQFSPYVGDSSRYPPDPRRQGKPCPEHKAPSYRPSYFEQFGARPRQPDNAVPQGFRDLQGSHLETGLPKGPNLQKSQGNPGSPRYQQTGSLSREPQSSQGFQFGAGVPAGPSPQQSDSHRFRAGGLNVPDPVPPPHSRGNSNASSEEQKGASPGYQNDGFSDRFETPPPQGLRQFSGSQEGDKRHQHGFGPRWEARQNRGHGS